MTTLEAQHFMIMYEFLLNMTALRSSFFFILVFEVNPRKEL